MKAKKLLLPSIFLAVTIIAYIVATLVFCYTTKPEISVGEFPFSVTYEYKGETKTISGIYKFEYSGSRTIHNQHNRYWEEEPIIENEGEYEFPNIVYQDETMTLSVYENMTAGYFMGDPLYADWYMNYGHKDPQPYVEYYDYVNGISLNDENKDEVLDAIDFKIIDYTYPEPIENSFSLSGIRYEADNIIFFVVISILFLLACVIFIRKDKEYKYTNLDKAGIVFNFLVGIFAVPFITILCFLFGIVESSIEAINQIVYNIPSFTIMTLALSVVFRRKSFSKTGFFIQFVGILLFAIIILLGV